jgi:putative ABC transport system substrate-binding protein
VVVGLGIWAVLPKSGNAIRIGVTQIVAHPILDAVRDGFVAGMDKAGYAKGSKVQYDFQNAQGEATTAQVIARKFVTDKVNLIFSIATPTSQAVARATSEIPIVFGAVTDPVSAGIVQSAEKPGKNITGVSDLVPVTEQVGLLLEIVPSVKRIGWIYNTGEANSQFAKKLIEDECKRRSLGLVLSTVANSSEVRVAAASLVGRVDAIYVAIDNTTASAIESIVKVAEEARLPVLASDTGLVERGAIATVGTDYRNVGLLSAELAVRVLKGEDPGKIPVVFAKGSDVWVNQKAAKAIGISIPDAVVKRASKIVN